jgi:hypothetical protein
MAIQRGKDRGVRKASVPDVVTVARTTAQASITALGFTYTETAETTGDAGLDQKIKTQSIAAGTVSNLGTNIELVYYNYVYPGFSHYAGFAHYAGFGHHYDPYFMSVSGNTGILTINGRKNAADIEVGDVLVGLDFAGTENIDPNTWSTTNFTDNGKVQTTVVSVNSRTTTHAYQINGDIYSETHWILCKKDDVVKFKLAKDLSIDYEIYSATDSTWAPVLDFEEIDFIDMVYSINCEPYDNFFTENMLVFDYNPSTD